MRNAVKRQGYKLKGIRIDPLDELFSQYIRMRAIQRVGGCEHCLHPKFDKVKDDGSILPAWKQLACCHFDGRGNKAVRCDEDNAIGGCFHCHTQLDAHPLEKVEWFTRHLGEERLNLLKSRMRITYPKPDKKAIELYLKNKIQGMELEDGNSDIQ